MKAAEELVKERTAVKLMLNIVREICNILKRGGSVDYDHLNKILDFLKTFVDTCHHAKEEQILFPAMTGAKITQRDVPIITMLHEREVSREYIKELSKDINDCVTGKKMAWFNIVAVI